jgi:hypothetical protein
MESTSPPSYSLFYGFDASLNWIFFWVRGTAFTTGYIAITLNDLGNVFFK